MGEVVRCEALKDFLPVMEALRLTAVFDYMGNDQNHCWTLKKRWNNYLDR